MSDIDTKPYRAWILKHLKDNDLHDGYGKCKEICNTMAKTFPELEIRKGNFESIAWGIRQHYWCRVNGQIIDPTGHQHPDGLFFPSSDEKYDDFTDMTEQEAIDAGKVPTGKCINCGKMIYYKSSCVCSPECDAEMIRAAKEGTL